MLSVLLLGFQKDGQAVPPGEAVRTLATLVPAAVEGVVRDVCLLAPLDSRELADVADHAGCVFAAAASFAEAIGLGSSQLRSSHVLVAQAGVLADRALVEELVQLLPTLDAGNRDFYVVRGERRDVFGRLFPILASPAALLAPREWLSGVRAAGFDRLVRMASPRRVMTATARLGA